MLRRQIVQDNQSGPLVVAIDDTLTRHTGRKIHGAKYRRDPMGPPFCVNFIRANRFLQMSMAYRTTAGQARMIPVDLVHAPTPDKPSAKATRQQLRDYRKQCQRHRLPRLAARRLEALRNALDEDGHASRVIWAVGDGGYTNKNLLKALPRRTLFIGRIRADAKLYSLPQANAIGRKRIYGRQLATPESIRHDETIPWRIVNATACGRTHAFHVKTLDVVRWRPSGRLNLRLIVVAPLGYRLSAHGRLQYRRPAYLICTDPQAPLEQVLQSYVWRSDIEVNFRDEKSLLGIAEAKVRDPDSVQRVPAIGVGAYGLLVLAGLRAASQGKLCDAILPPKWRPNQPNRISTNRLITQLRHELWHDALRKTDFARKAPRNTTCPKPQPHLESALYYASRSG